MTSQKKKKKFKGRQLYKNNAQTQQQSADLLNVCTISSFLKEIKKKKQREAKKQHVEF